MAPDNLTGRPGNRRRRTGAGPAVLQLLSNAVLWLVAGCALPTPLLGDGDAGPAWQVAGAEVRLVLEPADTAAGMQVCLPRNLRGKRHHLSAFAPDGTALPVYCIEQQGRLVAAEVNPPMSVAVSGGDPAAPQPEAVLPATVELYVSKTAVAAPPEAAPRRPVAVAAEFTKLRARPFSSSDLQELESRQTWPRAWQFLPDLRLPETWIEALPQPKRRRQATLRVHLRTTLVLSAPARVRFGVESTQAAWFIFADGKPVASWQHSQAAAPAAANAALLDDQINLAAGLINLDVFLLINPSEQAPVLVWQHGSAAVAPIPTAALLSPRQAQSLRLETRSSEAAAGLHWRQPHLLVLPEVGQVFAGISCRNVSRTPTGAMAAASLRVGDQLLQNFTTAELLVPGGIIPDLQLITRRGKQRLTLPLGLTWEKLLVLRPSLSIEYAPAVLLPEQPLQLRYTAELPTPTPPVLRRHAQLAWRFEDAANALRADGQRSASSRERTHDLELAVPAGGTQLRLYLQAFATPLAPSAHLRLLAPGDAFDGLRPRPGALRGADGSAVVLLAAPLARLPRPKSLGRGPIVVVEDMLAHASLPGADLLPDALLQDQLQRQVNWLSTRRDSPPDIPAAWRKFAALPGVLASKPAVVVWMIGHDDLSSDGDPTQLVNEYRFLLQATAAHGAVPVLVILPPLTEMPAEAARVAARLLKELALRLDIPVVDAYSQSVADFGAATGCRRFQQAAQPQVRLDTLDNAGRRWLYGQIATAVAALPDHELY